MYYIQGFFLGILFIAVKLHATKVWPIARRTKNNKKVIVFVLLEI